MAGGLPGELGKLDSVLEYSGPAAKEPRATVPRLLRDGEGFLCNPCPSLPRPREAPRLPSRGFFIYPHLPAQTCGLRLAKAARERPGGGDKKSAEAKSVAPTQASSANNNNSSNSIDTGKPDCCIAQSGARSAPAARASRDDVSIFLTASSIFLTASSAARSWGRHTRRQPDY